MGQSPTKPERSPSPDRQGISKWARTYAQNRSLGAAVSMIIFLALFAAIAGPSYLAGEAYRAGNMLLFWGCIAVLVPATGALLYLSVPRWGGKLQERIVKRLYAKEGSVAFSPPSRRAKFWGPVLGVCFGTCIVALVLLGFTFNIPIKYMQPISAIYTVPFFVGMWFLMRPMVGYLLLLWPLLYAIHAILIVAGAPILFTGSWDLLNMLIPVAGYGMLASIVSHLYSRVALRRLKSLTQTDSTGGDQPEEVGGQ